MTTQLLRLRHDSRVEGAMEWVEQHACMAFPKKLKLHLPVVLMLSALVYIATFSHVLRDVESPSDFAVLAPRQRTAPSLLSCEPAMTTAPFRRASRAVQAPLEMRSLRSSIIDMERGIERGTLGMFDKMHHLLHDDHPEWRHRLAQVLESHHFTGGVLLLVLMDMLITIYVIVAEHTNILNPAHSEKHHWFIHRSKRVAIAILSGFIIEQVGHFLAFGWSFFRKPWWILDLVVVCVTLGLELSEMAIVHRQASGRNLNRKLRALGHLVGFLRLWKFIAFFFDIFYVGMLHKALDEQAHHATIVYVKALENEFIKRNIPLPHTDAPIVGLA